MSRSVCSSWGNNSTTVTQGAPLYKWAGVKAEQIETICPWFAPLGGSSVFYLAVCLFSTYCRMGIAELVQGSLPLHVCIVHMNQDMYICQLVCDSLI